MQPVTEHALDGDFSVEIPALIVTGCRCKEDLEEEKVRKKRRYELTSACSLAKSLRADEKLRGTVACRGTEPETWQMQCAVARVVLAANLVASVGNLHPVAPCATRPAGSVKPGDE